MTMTDTTMHIPQPDLSDQALSAGHGTAGDFIALLKPRVMSLVVFTGLAGMMAAPGDIHPVLALSSLICIAVGAGASGALNMWYDADLENISEFFKELPGPKLEFIFRGLGPVAL